MIHDLKRGAVRLSDIFKNKEQLTLEEAFDAEPVRLEKEFKSGYYDKIAAIKKQIKNISIIC
jgi:hypothetical protein